MTDQRTTAQDGLPGANDSRVEETGLLDALIVLAKYKMMILATIFVTAMLAAVISLLLPNVYTGTARVLPPQHGQSASAAVLGQLSGLGSFTGILPNLKNPSDLYVGMLRSRTVADKLTERFNLKDVYEKDTFLETREALAEQTRIAAGKEGIITIEVDDEDPVRAAEMANAYVELLEALNESLALTEASQRRLFFEKQLVQTKDALASAEIELKKTQEKTGLIKLDDQGKAIIEAVAQLRAQTAAKEVQIGAMKSFATERNADLVRAQQELLGLREQLRRLEQNKLTGDGDILLPTGRVPEAGLEYIRKFREVKYQEAMFEMFAKQYEVARMDEGKEAALIQILDKATPPDRKSKPKRTLIVVLTTMIAGLASLVFAFLLEAYRSASERPHKADRLAMLRNYLRYGRPH